MRQRLKYLVSGPSTGEVITPVRNADYASKMAPAALRIRSARVAAFDSTCRPEERSAGTSPNRLPAPPHALVRVRALIDGDFVVKRVDSVRLKVRPDNKSKSSHLIFRKLRLRSQLTLVRGDDCCDGAPFCMGKVC